ncbi:MAG: T9SS type A sorting domain-containing protein, partial [Flavobacteriales bacterium]|nr:T9SS type A sorting domain-containing protein [Flavobacteriales bacterium]
NNQLISFVVDLGFNNAYWDGDLSITVSGSTNTNAWYLKKVSNNQIIASGWGGVAGATNSFPLEFNECYTLQNINGGNESYTVTDGATPPQIILQGTVSGPEDFDNFTTGNEVWTGIDNQEMTSISVYPSPAKDKLYVKGKYDYLRIIDLLGKEVLYSRYAESIDVSSLNNGLYLLEIISSDRRYTQKIQMDK